MQTAAGNTGSIARGRHHPKPLRCFVHPCTSWLGGTPVPAHLRWCNGCLPHQPALLLSPRLKKNWKMKELIEKLRQDSPETGNQECIKHSAAGHLLSQPVLLTTATSVLSPSPRGSATVLLIGHLPLCLQDPNRLGQGERKEGENVWELVLVISTVTEKILN